jgi:alpha-1,2-mannosyltransferase
LLLGLLVVLGQYLRLAGTHDQVDFGVYRAGGHAILTGRDLYTLRVPPVGLPFTYPPAAALFFAPLALIPVHAGQVIWTATSILGLCWFVRLTMRRYATGNVATNTTALLVVLILIARSNPVGGNLSLGQINVLIGLLVVADLCGALSRIPRGVMSGVAAALKLTPLFLVAYFVAVRRYRAASVAACTFAGVTALAFLVAPRASTAYWLHGYFADARRTGGIAYISNQSINGVIVRLTGSPSNAPVFWFPAVIVTGAVVLSAVRRLHDRRPWLAESIAVAAMLLLSPVSWVHHWILVFPFLVACFRLCAHRKQWGVLLLLTCMLSASLWFGIVWHVPNTHDREYHHTVWEFLVGNSDVLLLLAVLAVVLLAFATNGDASAEANAGTILTSK